MKKLQDLIYKAGITEVVGSTNISISSIFFDNRKVISDSLFIAVKGTTNDGHNFIESAIENGAIAIICEQIPQIIHKGITYVKVADSTLAIGIIASNYHDNPSEKLKVVGITGTNGKTTVATLLFQLFRNLGHKVGLLSTIKNQINDEVLIASHTTPDAIQINSLMSQMLDEGCTHCFMEVSSHAIDQNRIAGIKFAGGVFTNITHDHLDYHKTFAAYLKAKRKFFDSLNDEAFALMNIDDKNGLVMVQNSKAKVKTYSLKSMSDFKCKIIENQFEGLLLNIDDIEVLCRLVGTFNAYNLLAIYGSAILLGEDKIAVLQELSKLMPAEGRFDCIRSESNVIGIIDYAHTPDALENVLKTINEVRTGNEKVITVVGCGGDRDTLKRPEMAKIASELSNKVILTSDNPRSEEPEDIIRQMRGGISPVHFKNTLAIVDRKEAIRTACSLANSNDIILLAGKGHEKYQEIKGVRYPMDDKQILMETFAMQN
jgi:UDP-N-acetylmuramoyl-L-alanyl-D-glutamate--2,6-diaminopimelate ligase